MKNILKKIKNVVLVIVLFLYFLVIIGMSSLLLNKNDYGVTQFGNKVWILVDDEIANDKYKSGSLVILETKKIGDLKTDDEIFIYGTKEKNLVKIIVSNIEEVHNVKGENKYIVLKNDDGTWAEEFIAGTASKVYDNYGKILSFLGSKWIFFVLLIVPCFFILIYEIYTMIIFVKYDTEETEEDTVKENVKAEPVDTKEETDDDRINKLMKEIEELKSKNNANSSATLDNIENAANLQTSDYSENIAESTEQYEEEVTKLHTNDVEVKLPTDVDSEESLDNTYDYKTEVFDFGFLTQNEKEDSEPKERPSDVIDGDDDEIEKIAMKQNNLSELYKNRSYRYQDFDETGKVLERDQLKEPVEEKQSIIQKAPTVINEEQNEQISDMVKNDLKKDSMIDITSLLNKYESEVEENKNR